MSSSTVFNTEYDLFDSDDGLGGSPLPFIDFINTDSDALQSFEASRTGDPKALLAPKPHSSAQPAGATPESLNASFQDSASDSSSSKRTGSSSSTKTGITSGDVMMTDGLDLKAEADWNPENFVNGNENDFLAFDGTIDPSSIDGTFNFSDRGMENAFDFGSPSNSPSPFATGTIDGASPQTQATFTNSSIKGSPAAAKSPARGHNKAFSLIISPIPPKSRVETQIPIRMGLFPLPPGIKRLHLPTHTISKPKLLAKPRPDPSADLLELHTTLVCTSAMQNPEMKKKALARAAANAPPFAADSRSNEGASDDDEKPQSGGEVGICDGCMMRERKRAARKKAKKPEEEESWLKDERKRVIVFNTQEIKEWQAPTAIVPNTNPPEQFITNGAMQIDAPMRIACYCRHHGEKSGFQVIFTIKDWRGQLIAQALSPSIMITDDHKTHTQTQFNHALTSGLFASAGATATRVPPSVIHKVIPNEGPISGGVEVTILGEGFYQGLEVMFGDRRATTTTFWGETSLHPIFNYTDDYENQLIRTALTVMSAKMTGKIEDAREIARRLQMPGGGSSGGNDYNGNGGSSGNTYNVNFETQLLKVLEFLDLDDSTNKARLNLRRKSGHAMLHLACALGLHRFVAGLLARGANPDVKDKGGFTPLHFASLNDQPEIVRRLIYAGADPTLRSINGLTAADVAQSRDVIRAIRRVERHVRSRSGGSLHSRASSATSLRSLWEPPSAPVASVEFSTEESESAGESPEYTSGDFNSEEDDLAADGSAWLELRRSSTRGSVHSPIAQDGGRTPLHVTNADVPGGLASPTAAMTAFRDQVAAQIHQFQQSMALQLQNLPHFPYFSQMPNMPPMPDYQAYLNSAPPVLQRMTSFLPNMGGSRPGSAGEQPQSKEMEGRWWGVSSLMPTSSAPPPSYDEIFPQQDLDKKQSSAAQAAAEAEADSKCATLYDQPSTSSAPVQQLPKLLQIGRKNAITKEQQDNLRRAHAENLKRLSRDRNLFFIWDSQIPLLVMIMCSMLYSRFPGAFSAVFSFLPSFTSNTQALQTIPERVVEIA
ncbi:putative ankyrin repeat protein [Phaeoacremonium minimum UCRPA7]|uniref:Putative ankyrin repeat protein n=1 Tax=Phaeoacremonium minimum (strain UCR-PA7) TaxID=1286976 RepID=R8BKY1_PHAM7|nr:putative ankyrin repeat protein [Phaeoacremonium minimum UCRPA7]EOO00009.1 putative ankyrin repeat protein [Phaeoacremonium minimum UCRPA7]